MMTEINQSDSLGKLTIVRAGGPLGGPRAEVEAVVLASVARVLKEVAENGAMPAVTEKQLSSERLKSLYQELARRAWEEPELPGESPVSPLHLEHNGWGLPLDSDPDQPSKARKLPWLVLAMDAIDFLCAMMGPRDTLIWEEGAS